jgi:hypothetical protein
MPGGLNPYALAWQPSQQTAVNVSQPIPIGLKPPGSSVQPFPSPNGKRDLFHEEDEVEDHAEEPEAELPSCFPEDELEEEEEDHQTTVSELSSTCQVCEDLSLTPSSLFCSLAILIPWQANLIKALKSCSTGTKLPWPTCSWS